jgi:SAM-dependent methyltransferase
MARTSRSAPFDRVAHEYDRTRGGVERGEGVAVALAPLLPLDDPLLEIGVGTGLVAGALARRGRLVTGVDLSLSMLRHANQRVPGRMVVGDALRLPIGSDTVAAAVLIHVLHLVGDIAAALAEAARVVRPGGRIVASTATDEPPPASDVGDILGQMRSGLGIDDHQRPDREAAVVAAARRSGLATASRITHWPGHLTLSPAEVIARTTTRSWSWMWDADEETWADVARPAIEALRRLPDQDRPRAQSLATPLVAFTRATP